MSQRFPRKDSNKGKPNKVIYIYSEGEVTEQKYFEAIKSELGLSTIKIVGTGFHTVSLVEEVMGKMYKSEEGIETEWWVVFDKDDWKDFDVAISLAKKNGINVAYSNECFELWFILHYNLLENDIGRDGYDKILTEKFSFNYEREGKQSKNSSRIYDLIKDKEEVAHRNAAHLLKVSLSEGKKRPSEMTPSTTVHLLVEKLRELKKERK